MKTILDETRLDLAKLFKGTGVEVGIAGGGYSKVILDNGVDKLYGVDPYAPHRGYRDYTRSVTFDGLRSDAHALLDGYPNYEFIEEFSMDAVKRFDDNSLDFVYIDADHSYGTVFEDITEWIKKVKPGGIIAGDDYVRGKSPLQYYDVIHAVNDYVARHNIPELFIYAAGRTPTNWMFRRPA